MHHLEIISNLQQRGKKISIYKDQQYASPRVPLSLTVCPICFIVWICSLNIWEEYTAYPLALYH